MTDIEIAAFVLDEFEKETFTNHPADGGKHTKWGMTRPYIAAYLRCPVDEVPLAIIRNLTREKAIDIFVEMEFTRKPLYRLIDWRPKLATTDFGFNAGDDDSIPALQRAVGAQPDGQFGPKTFQATLDADPYVVAIAVTTERLTFHVSKSYNGVKCQACKLPSQITFLRGWVNRCAKIQQRVTEVA